MKTSYYSAILISALQMVLLAIFLNQQLMQKYNYLQFPNNDIVNLGIGFFVFGLNILVIIVIRNLNKTNQEMERLRINELKFQHITEQNLIYRQHHHDFKKHLLISETYLKKHDLEKLKKYLATFSDKLDEGIFHINTGLEELDALFNVKLSHALTKNIKVKFHCMAKLEQHKENILELVIILGNLLDNAIEACASLEENIERKLEVELREDLFGTVITMTNTYNGIIIDEEKLFTPGFSSKKGKQGQRGQGLPIVYKTIKKLGGKLTVQQDAAWFKVTAEIKK